jgi:hypothetical protein
MKQLWFFSVTLSLLLCFASCGGECEMKTEVSRLEATLAEKEAALVAALEAGGQGPGSENVIVHTVYLKLKESLDESSIANLIAETKKLQDIASVQNLQVGTFQDLDDPRAMSDYGLVLQMEFSNEAAYRLYQDDPIHVALRESLGEYLAGPPLTHDFLTK